MISLDIKSDAKNTTILSSKLSTPSDEPTISFSELLRGVSTKKDDKNLQNGSLILSLNTEEKISKDTKVVPKADTLLGLLKGDEVLTKEEPIELNPKLVENLSVKDIKVLVADAKEYLKNKIQSSDEYKLSQVKELPKTIKGLASMAKELGMDISKITIEEIQTKQPLDKLAKVDSIPLKDISQDKQTSKKSQPIEDALQSKELVKDTPKTKALHVEVKTNAEAKVNSSSNSNSKENLNTQVKSQVQQEELEVQTISTKEVSKKDTLAQTKAKEPLHVETQAKEEKKQQVQNSDVDVDVDSIDVKKTDDKYSKISKDVKATPLFKAQETAHTVTTTEQIVQVKAIGDINTQVKTSKDKADETLKLLLRGEKTSMKEAGFTADFSVATAKVIAPSATTESKKAMETLLHGDVSSSAKDVDGSPESMSVHKADSFEVKLNEAKQMIKYLSSDVKTAIEDYKSPFTRVKVQLNPQKLGEVDLTIVQRGKNLHVNISSNNTAINTLSMNVNDLRTQLSNNGINNASLNFSDNAQDNQNTQQQQQSRQNERQAKEEYGYFDKEETNEEVLSSLEIVVPQYV